MASGSNSTVITNPNGGKYNLLISWNENSTSVSDNTSNITVTAKLTKNNSRFNVNNAGVLRAYWHDDRTNSDTEFASIAVTELGYNSTERVASGTRNMTHKDDGTLNGYAYASWTRNSTYGGYVPVSGTCSTGWTALTTIARKATVKTVQNFNDEGNPVLGYENKAGNSANTLQAGIFKTDGSTTLVGYRDISKTGSSYTFNLTTDERNTLRAAIPNSNSMKVRFYVKTVIGSNTFYDYKEATFSITNANPTFTNFTFRDGNSATLTITGNDQYIIQNKSSLVAEISTTNKAVANKSATMSSYVFEIASYSGTENYSTSAITKTIGAINATANQNLKITAKDSRGNSTAVSKTVNIVPYSSPVVNASATRQNNFENNTTIKVSGSASLLKVNNVVKNDVNATNGVQYRYKDASTSTWGSWTNIASSYNTSSGAITTTDFVLSLDNTKVWNFEFRIIDKLETKTVSITVSQGQPQFFIGADGRVSVGGIPSVSKESGNLGQLEVYGALYAKNLRSTGNAYANGNRLAELPITRDMLRSNSVTSDKIDWATFTCGLVSSPTSTVINANSRIRFAQITLPKGKYALIATASYWANTNARRGLYISFESTTGGSINSTLNGAYGTPASGDTIEVTNTALVNITSSNATISAYVNSLDFSGTFHQWGAPSVLYFRVG